MKDQFDHLFIAPQDFCKSLDFYQNNLNWKVVTSWGEAGEPRGAVLKSESGTQLVLAEQHAPKDDQSWEEGKGVLGSHPTLHLNTENVDQRFTELKDSECAVIKPEDTHWGTRWMVLRDPDGNLIAFNSNSKNDV